MLVTTEQLQAAPEEIMAAVRSFSDLQRPARCVRQTLKRSREIILNSTGQLLLSF